jgi:hypothetical protein
LICRVEDFGEVGSAPSAADHAGGLDSTRARTSPGLAGCGSRKARLSRLLVGCNFEPLDDFQARPVGEFLAKARSTDIVDDTTAEGAQRRQYSVRQLRRK